MPLTYEKEYEDTDYVQDATTGRWSPVSKIVKVTREVTWPTWTREREHTARQIVQSFLGDAGVPRPPVDVVEQDEGRPCFAAYGCRGYVHDEGWSVTYVEVTAREDGAYDVKVTTDSRDCDGPHKQYDDYIVRRRARPARRKYDRRWNDATGRMENHGRPWRRSPFVTVKTGSSQRDYFAEAAGY
jgi:hypothetical protein